jgi:ATP-dependent Clp protease, protease subunit
MMNNKRRIRSNALNQGSVIFYAMKGAEKTTKRAEKFWEVKASAEEGVGELYIYGNIHTFKWGEDDPDTTAQSFKEDLESLGDISTLHLYINSPGGAVFQGNAIYNIIKRHRAKVYVHVDGLAASIASVIAMAGDVIHMPANALMMIHNPWTFAIGNSAELRKQAEDMDKIRDSMIETYLDKSGDKLSREKLVEMLDAETWLSAQECLDYGLCDVVEASREIAASIDPKLMAKYQNTPKKLLKDSPAVAQESAEDKALREQLLKDSKISLKNIETYLGGISK